jgi:ribosomal protein bL25 (Ctc-form)
MAEISIKGTMRTEFGKGAARKTRREGLVPAVIYGHGETPTHISLPAREVGVAIKTANVLLDIDLGSKTELTLPKSIVRNAIKGNIEHIDLVIVRRGERVKVQVPVHAVTLIVKVFSSTSITPSKWKLQLQLFQNFLLLISLALPPVIPSTLQMYNFLKASHLLVIQRWSLFTSPYGQLLKKCQSLLRLLKAKLLL